MPVIYFPYLIGLANTSIKMVNGDGDSEHLCLVPVFRRNSHAQYIIIKYNHKRRIFYRCLLSDRDASFLSYAMIKKIFFKEI